MICSCPKRNSVRPPVSQPVLLPVFTRTRNKAAFLLANPNVRQIAYNNRTVWWASQCSPACAKSCANSCQTTAVVCQQQKNSQCICPTNYNPCGRWLCCRHKKE
ncbi:hypothetical protein NECAME_06106 [Necator americanus]|uniref:Uncharacterized protein n=1 Tax=Necator americanus TaxID=51031 RepID=W2TYA4_NECAM|nr:hypothetical protein NECAME_06106 [Necator americanus]ETN86031.1 hypothetical protein NECAME_06106 [Necator americanus]